jgi:hypothetical protein
MILHGFTGTFLELFSAIISMLPLDQPQAMVVTVVTIMDFADALWLTTNASAYLLQLNLLKKKNADLLMLLRCYSHT